MNHEIVLYQHNIMVVRCKSLQQGVNFMFASLLALQKEKEKTITKPHTLSKVETFIEN